MPGTKLRGDQCKSVLAVGKCLMGYGVVLVDQSKLERDRVIGVSSFGLFKSWRLLVPRTNSK